jgi:hypothetical protein
MKTYIVFDVCGRELGFIKAGSHNSAEKKAKKKFGGYVNVCYTEV